MTTKTLEQITGNRVDRYKFEAPPRATFPLQPAFFHNGAFTRLEDAVRHHLNASDSARHYSSIRAGVDKDLTYRLGPIEPAPANLDPAMSTALGLDQSEFEHLVAFLRRGLLDERASPKSLCAVSAPCGSQWNAGSEL